MAEGRSDWRLQGQERYLTGVPLIKRAYRQNATNPNWDHAHCEFCFAEFSLVPNEDTLREGYATADDYHWVCVRCFEDFKDMFA
jgi:hypothetical protein